MSGTETVSGKLTGSAAFSCASGPSPTSTHPNWDATEQKRSYTISGDELKYVGVSAVVGGASATLTWKRAK